jgi:type 1 fimbriae regulatory protein FimB
MLESLTYDELLAVLKAAKAQRIRNWCMILMAFSHGLRASEVCGLKLADLRDGHVLIARRKGSHDTVHQVVPHKGTPLLDEVKALREWLVIRPTDVGDALFPSNKGGNLSPTQFYRIYHCAASECGLPASKSHPHTLKHTCVSLLIQENMNLAKVAAFVGHASISSTMRYVSISDAEASREAINTLMKLS